MFGHVARDLPRDQPWTLPNTTDRRPECHVAPLGRPEVEPLTPHARVRCGAPSWPSQAGPARGTISTTSSPTVTPFPPSSTPDSPPPCSPPPRAPAPTESGKHPPPASAATPTPAIRGASAPPSPTKNLAYPQLLTRSEEFLLRPDWGRSFRPDASTPTMRGRHHSRLERTA